jgi:hypothetical protein
MQVSPQTPSTAKGEEGRGGGGGGVEGRRCSDVDEPLLLTVRKNRPPLSLPWRRHTWAFPTLEVRRTRVSLPGWRRPMGDAALPSALSDVRVDAAVGDVTIRSV